MRSTVRLVVVLVVAGICISSAAYAGYDTAAKTGEQTKAALVDAGNKICPVSGDKVSGKDFYEYNGKRYGLCCPMCTASFENDPVKYSGIADKEVAGKK